MESLNQELDLLIERLTNSSDFRNELDGIGNGQRDVERHPTALVQNILAKQKLNGSKNILKKIGSVKLLPSLVVKNDYYKS